MQARNGTRSMVVMLCLGVALFWGAAAQASQHTCRAWIEERPIGNWQNLGGVSDELKQASADCIGELTRLDDAARLVLLNEYLMSAVNLIKPDDLVAASGGWSDAAKLKVSAVRAPFVRSPYLEDGSVIADWLEEARRTGDDYSRARFAFYLAYYLNLKDEFEQSPEQRDALLQESFDAGQRVGTMRIGLFALQFQAIFKKQDGNYAEAVRALNSIIENSDERRFEHVRISAFGTLAYLFYEIGDYDRAIGLFDRGLAVSDGHFLTKAQLQLNKSIALAAADRLDEAETSIRSAINRFNKYVAEESTEGAVFPGLYNSRFELARIQYRRGDIDPNIALAAGRKAAVALYEEDYFTESVHAEAFTWLAEKYLEEGRNSEAEEMLDMASQAVGTKIDPENVDSDNQDRAFLIPYLRSMATLKRRSGDFEEASMYASAALELSDQRFEQEQLRAVGNADLIFELEEQEDRARSMEQAALLSATQAQLATAASNRNMTLALLAAVLLVAAGLIGFFYYRAYRAQAAITAARESFFVEMHHRVANNLQTLLSLFRIDLRRSEGFAGANHDPTTDATVRLQTMALLHDKLRMRGEGGAIDAGNYLCELKNLLAESLAGDEVKIDGTFDHAMVDTDKAVPLGLMVSEMVTNSVKHAFPGRSGKVHIAFHAEDEVAHLTVSDNGTGIKTEEDESKDGMGVDLIQDFAEQIGASARCITNPEGSGTVWEVKGIAVRGPAPQ